MCGTNRGFLRADNVSGDVTTHHDVVMTPPLGHCSSWTRETFNVAFALNNIASLSHLEVSIHAPSITFANCRDVMGAPWHGKVDYDTLIIRVTDS